MSIVHIELLSSLDCKNVIEESGNVNFEFRPAPYSQVGITVPRYHTYTLM